MAMQSRAAGLVAFSFLSILVLGSCAQHSRAGSGPLPKLPGFAESYQKYRQTFAPIAFAISADGRVSNSTSCPEPNCYDHLRAIDAMLEACDARSTTRCYLYDVGGRIVWDENAPPKPSAK